MNFNKLLRRVLMSTAAPKSPRRRRTGQSCHHTELLETRQLLTSFTTDIDGDGLFSPVTDGVIAFRYLSGQTGDALTRGSVNPGGRRTDPADILAFLETDEMQRLLDLDGDGQLSPLTDGVLLQRGLSGNTGENLTRGATNPNGIRSQPEHIQFVIDITSNVDDRYQATEGTLLTVTAADGVLQNDAPNSTIVSFDATTAEGATVVLQDDGSFTYDPRDAASLTGLSAINSVSDSFAYTARLPSGGTTNVTVIVDVVGQLTGGADLLTTDDNTAIGTIKRPKGAPASEPESLLLNDIGDGLTVVDFTAESEFGAVVRVNADGKWQYDPTESVTLNSLAAGESIRDRFHYTSEDSAGERREVEVIVEVSGVNDAPRARAFQGQTTFGDGPLTLFPLNFSSDAEPRDEITLVEAYPVPNSETLGTITTNADGSVTYETDDLLGRIPNGDTHLELFFYKVRDQHGGESTGELGVVVTGIPHAPEARDDFFMTSASTSFSNTRTIQTPIEESVLSNDSDLDGDEVVIVNNTQPIITELGATVSMFSDGTFRYIPHSSVALREFEPVFLVDTFQYTVSDPAGHGQSTATVTVEVFNNDYLGSTGPVLDLSSAAVSPTTNGASVSLRWGTDPETGLNTTNVFVFDEVAQQTLLVADPNTIDSYLSILGTSGPDMIVDPHGTFPVNVALFGGAGDDKLVGGQGDDRISGGTGNDTLIGGLGNDIIFGGDGVDEILGGEGVNELYTGAGADVIRDPRPSQWEWYDEDWSPAWHNTYPLPYALQNNDGTEVTVSLVGLPEYGDTSVLLTGPTGIGFELNGEWTVTSAGNGGETFSGSNVQMETVVGPIPLGNVTLNAGADARDIFGTGPLESASGGIFHATNWLFNNPVINLFNEATGLEFNSNIIEDEDFNFGLKLGSDLRADDLKNFDAPLNPAVPYFFATFNPEPNQVSLGDVSISPTGSQHAQFALAIDPTDPFFWISGEINGKGGSIGWSSRGRIPFEPAKRPTAIPATVSVYGNVYGSVKFPFKKVFEFEGNAVLDLDRDVGPGRSSGSIGQSLQRDRFIDLFTGDSADWEDVVDIVTHTEIGINGTVTFNPEIKKTDLTLSIPIAEGTAMFVGGDTVAFRGGSPDTPFGDDASILNEILGSLARVDVDGSFDFASGDFDLDVSSNSGGLKIGPFETASNSLDFSISNAGVDLAATIDTPVGSLDFDANIAFEETTETNLLTGGTKRTKPGVFRFVGQADTSSLNLGVASFSASAKLSLDNWNIQSEGNDVVIHPGAVELTILLGGSADLGIAEIVGNASIEVSSSGSFSGSARIRVIPVALVPEFSLSVRVSNSGISFEVLGIDVTIPIPSFLHVDPGSIPADIAQVGERIVESALPGIIDEAIRRLEQTGLRKNEAELLDKVRFEVAPLDDASGVLGYAAGQAVTIDDNAAGYGWFVDSTPQDDAEFGLFSSDAPSGSDAYRRVDLLSVVMHELTHVLEVAFPDREFRFGETGDEVLRIGQRFGTLANPPVVAISSDVDAEISVAEAVFADLTLPLLI